MHFILWLVCEKTLIQDETWQHTEKESYTSVYRLNLNVEGLLC